ncbi:MAG: tRNA uridine-5-carboxymethylaminomethyl(34) synthesis GTPase MnmE [Pseudomarimonas sp.]
MTNPQSPTPNPGSNTDTIAAIATAAGVGGIGVVRVSGPLATQIAEALLGRTPQARHAHFARFLDADGGLIDRGLLLHFPAPHSYTGEHVLELQVHGSAPVLDALLRRVCGLGARIARPGEFTQSAFLNGKLDLAQAEAVADLIAAGSQAAARAALRSLDGEFSRRVEALRQGLLRLRVHVEAAIDFPEEEIDFLGDGQIAAALVGVRAEHAALLTESQRGQRLRDGLHVVIVGPPNAGKSSLLNALAGSERAIVTAIAGTTRDLLREALRMDGVEISLVDTAGLRRHSDDPIEREGMRRAHAERQHADLLLAVVEDGDETAERELRQALADAAPAGVDGLTGSKVVWIHNKIDQTRGRARRENSSDGTHLWLSAISGDGMDTLRQLLKVAATGDAGEGTFSARARHVAALERAGDWLELAHQQLQNGAGELVAEELRSAHEALGEITGSVRSDDLLGEIFSSFCIGK